MVEVVEIVGPSGVHLKLAGIDNASALFHPIWRLLHQEVFLPSEGVLGLMLVWLLHELINKVPKLANFALGLPG